MLLHVRGQQQDGTQEQPAIYQESSPSPTNLSNCHFRAIRENIVQSTSSLFLPLSSLSATSTTSQIIFAVQHLYQRHIHPSSWRRQQRSIVIVRVLHVTKYDQMSRLNPALVAIYCYYPCLQERCCTVCICTPGHLPLRVILLVHSLVSYWYKILSDQPLLLHRAMLNGPNVNLPSTFVAYILNSLSTISLTIQL